MPGLARCSISIDKDLLRAFDEQTAREGYPTRSEAVKALIRKALIEREWERGGASSATADCPASLLPWTCSPRE